MLWKYISANRLIVLLLAIVAAIDSASTTRAGVAVVPLTRDRSHFSHVKADSGRIVENFVLDYRIGKTNASLSWNVDWKVETLNFAIRFDQVIGSKTFTLGFSDDGIIENGFDTCSGNLNKLIYDQEGLVDGYVDFFNGSVHFGKDLHQDCELKKVELHGNDSVTVHFDRKFVTCDPRDYAFESSTMNIFLFIDPDKHSYNFTEMPSQLRSTVLLRPKRGGEPPKSADLMAKEGSKRWYLDLLMDNVEVPNNVTTYWSKTFELNKYYEENLNYVLQAEFVLSPQTAHLVHHAFIYACTGPVEYEGPANGPGSEVLQKCNTGLFTLGMGMGPVIFPNDTGLPVGRGNTFAKNVMVEIYYHNFNRQSGLRDSSGFRLLFTSEKQKYSAGIMQTGLAVTDASAVPPGQKRWALTGHCCAPCTDNFPPNGIYIFGSVLHAHQTGRHIFTTLYRNGEKIAEVGRNNHYYANYQHFSNLEKHVQVLPGGFGYNDEMCLGFFWYYPAVPISLCQSAIDNTTLVDFFKRNGLKAKHRSLTLRERFENIEWNQQKLDELKEVYDTGDQMVHCYSPTDIETKVQFENVNLVKTLLVKNKTDLMGSIWERIPRPELRRAIYETVRNRDVCPSINSY